MPGHGGGLAQPSSSAAGVLAFLEDPNSELQARALQKLLRVVDQYWAEIANALPLIEALSEDETFPAHELAAAVASKCFYHLEEYNDGLRLALAAGKYFDINEKSEYVDTLLSKCIDEYNQLREAQASGEEVTIDPRMEYIIEQMFQRCYNDGTFNQAIGVALEGRRLDKVKEVIERASDKAGILDYTFRLCQQAVGSREFRLSVLEILVELYGRVHGEPDFSNVCQCLQHLDRPQHVAQILMALLHGTQDQALMAYQIAFNLVETENQGFVLEVVSHSPQLAQRTEELEQKQDDPTAGGEALDVATQVPRVATDEEVQERVGRLRQILCEGFDVDLTLNFLFRQSHTDLQILQNIKAAVESRNSILHNATVVAHGYMNAGTTMHNFLRDNLDWLGRASNWAKFTAVASIGVVHKGQVHESMKLLEPYLPQGGMSSSPFSEGGALYALGLIHVNKGGSGDSATISYLSDALRNAGTNETVQHGACLGIGLASMATANPMLLEELKGTLFTDSAVAGEAAALALGFLLAGTGPAHPLTQASLGELLAYAHDTQHEKIIRALSLAVAFMMYGREEEADPIIEQLARDRDSIVRYGAMYAIAMAYCGTSNNKAVRRLLHVAVSDVNDDVRRAAVTCLGFVLFRTPSQVPRLVSLLAESFNPHVRYGACMAVGIACAGSADENAIELLQPMLEDAVDFVRQGAYLAMALVLMQQAEARTPVVKRFRERIASAITDKHQPVMFKMGAILAAGILDAGGRNVVVSLQSRAGFMRMSAVIGLATWLQYWYWYPLMHFLSLSFAPTMLIGLNKDFNMPNNFVVTCNAKPSLFAYPKKLEDKKEDKKEKVATAVLSTTAKAKAREARREARRALAAGAGLERVPSTLTAQSEPMTIDESTTKEVSPKRKRQPEPSSFQLSNPARVTPAQEEYVVINTDATERYVPIYTTKPAGIIMLKDRQPGQAEDVEKVERVAMGQEEEAEPPEPFEWSPDSN